MQRAIHVTPRRKTRVFIGDREIGAGRLTEKRSITDASPRRQ
jgi:hypothetical protein